MADTHWAAQLIGKPYRLGARGPEAFDCWGLLQYAWRLRYGVLVPDVRREFTTRFERIMRDGRDSCGRYSLVEVPRAIELDAVFMTSHIHPHHVGLWIQPDEIGGVLHTFDGAGVVFQRRADLTNHDLQIVKITRMVIE